MMSGIVLLLFLVFGLPRKKNQRQPNMEGLDSPEVAKAFNKMTNLPPFKLLYMKIVSKIKKLNPNGILVDVGCGAGNLIVKIAQKMPALSLKGVDISPEILEYAKERAIKNSVENKIEFKIGTVEDLPFPDNSIDIIVSSLSLHHWLSPIDAFNEIKRVLKEDGRLILFDFRRDSRKIYYGFLKFITKVVVPKVLKQVKEPLGSLQSSYTKDEVNNLLSKDDNYHTDIDPLLCWMFIIGYLNHN